MDVVTHSPEDHRRRELGAFLRSRRERLSPSD
ncbi:MAG: transcriptional regulator, partial [Mesorhizobium sp.]